MCVCVCVLVPVLVRGPLFIGSKSEDGGRQGQSDPSADCGDERSFHFGCLDNGDFSPLDSISRGFRLHNGNYFPTRAALQWRPGGCLRRFTATPVVLLRNLNKENKKIKQKYKKDVKFSCHPQVEALDLEELRSPHTCPPQSLWTQTAEQPFTQQWLQAFRRVDVRTQHQNELHKDE